MDETTTQNLSKWQPVEWLANLLDCHASTIHRLFEDERDQVRWRGYLIERREATNADRRALDTRARTLVRALLPEIETAPPAETALAVIPQQLPVKGGVQADLLFLNEFRPAAVPLPEETARGLLNDLVAETGERLGYEDGEEFRDLWRRVYRKHRRLYHIDIRRRAKSAGVAPLDYAEAHGHDEELYAVARSLFAPLLAGGAA